MTQDVTQTPAEPKQTFADLGVEPQIVQAMADEGIEYPFPIQELAIPIALSGADMIGQARTGTGKTLAFGIPVLQRLVLPGSDDFAEGGNYGKPQALIMTPTRELAMQVGSDLTLAARNLQARVLTIYGGVDYDPQLKALTKGVDVVVGTPGRLLDLVHRHELDLTHVRIAVLDESDEMLNLGFLPDVEKLLDQVPNDRQTLLFSATMPAVIMSLARSRLNQPVHIRAEGRDAQATVPQTTQFVYQAHDLDKPEMVGKALQAEGMHKMMVFTRTKRQAQRLADDLRDRGFEAASLHGDLNQTQREKTMKRFRNNKITVLVCTDVAARGIDVDDVTHVVNYEVPDDPEQYVHRIGRTGRAGHEGVAITLVDWQDVTRWKVINKALDLDFHEIPETYSTSENFLADLGIDPSLKGHIGVAKPHDAGEHSSDHDNRGGKKHDRDRKRGRDDQKKRSRRGDDKAETSSDHRKSESSADKGERKPRRKRRRTRNGKPVEKKADKK